MKPLLLSTFDILGGASRAAYRLHRGLRGIGVDSKMLAQIKLGDDADVIGPGSVLKKGLSFTRYAIGDFPSQLYNKKKGIRFSPAWLPVSLIRDCLAVNPDLVHLHWVLGGMIRIEALRKLNKPIVWTLHDMWAFTGGCHYDEGCGRYKASCGSCPILRSQRERDLSRWIWKRKQRAWKDLDLTLVTPSRWMGDRVRESSLFKDQTVAVIPNGLDTECFKPTQRKAARDILRLPQNRLLILFGAMLPTGEERKGFRHLQSALMKMKDSDIGKKAELVVLGMSEPAVAPDLGLKTHYVGQLHDETTIALVYAAADVFVLPSEQDNLPNTVMEALACGTPVVSFDVGGVPEMIDHQVNGYLAKALDEGSLAAGIQWVLEDPDRYERLSGSAREKAVREYALSIQARRFLDLYGQLIARQTGPREPNERLASSEETK